MKLGILTAFRDQHKYYVRSCEELGIDYEIIDIIGPDWLENVKKSDCDGFVCRPPSKYQERKAMYDEKLYTISHFMNRPIYPSYDELFIYENKKMMAYWLELNGFPHVPTKVFYKKADYLQYVENANYPLVFKTNTGSTGKGVKIIKNKVVAKRIANHVFGFSGTKLATGYTPQKTGKILPVPAIATLQRHYALIQEFKQIKWEWRVVKVGDSYFGHKKLLKGDFASGSKLKGWDLPPKAVLNLVKDICEKGNFLSMSVDIFETVDNELLVNELQAIWGQSTTDLMYKDEKPGRIIERDGEFVFEEGEFTQHSGFMLRVKHFIEILKRSNR